MKTYLLSVLTPTGGTPPPPEALAAIGRNIEEFHHELKSAGAWVFAGGLESPGSARVLRLEGDAQLMTDGPFAEGKEYVGGFCIVKAEDLDAALEWARKCARATTLPVEVRPFHWVSSD
jgi:hypothetical protein